MKLTLLPIQKDEVLRVRCDGPVSLTGSNPDGEPLQELLGPHCFGLNVLLNLEQAQGIDTSGVIWLMRAHKRFAGQKGKLVLYLVPPMVSALLDILHLTDELAIAASEPAARDLALDGGQTRRGRPPEKPGDDEVGNPLRFPR
jgi:anti-anti-sigma regulatory factor